MRRYRLEIDNVRSHLRSLWVVIGLQGLIIVALWIGWSQAPKQLRVYVPPDLRSGAVLAAEEVPPANVYAFAFYIFYALALTVLVLKPALQASSLKKALYLGAVFGFAAYMTYDLTNLATTRDWTLSVTIVDLLWGTFLTTLVSGFTYFISKKYLKF